MKYDLHYVDWHGQIIKTRRNRSWLYCAWMALTLSFQKNSRQFSGTRIARTSEWEM